MCTIDVTNPPASIFLGRVGESYFRSVKFDVSAWLAEYPAGIISVVYQRPDGLIYPITVPLQDGIFDYSPNATDLAIAGIGKIEIRLLLNDVIGKSAIIQTRIVCALGEPGAVPAPEPPDWVNTVSQQAAQTAENAEAAQAAREAAETAQEYAQSNMLDTEAAKEAAQVAQGLAELAKSDAQAAKGSAELSAQRAAQAVATGQYMAMEIQSNGCLYFEKTDQMDDLSFALIGDGELEVTIG